MGVGYQFTDRWAFDYELWYLDGLKMPLRGPRTGYDLKSRYWTFVGAAQTFGRFSSRPFPAMVSEWHSVPHVNLGFAGAGAEYFAKNPELLDVINNSELCFLQIMSGRSTSTQLLKTVGFGGVLEFTSGPLQKKRFLAATAYRNLLEHYGRDAVRQQIEEVRKSWTEAYRELLTKIHVPVVCIWIDQADEASDSPNEKGKDILGGFPHLITEAEIGVFADLGTEVVRAKLGGHPGQLLVNYPTKTPVDIFDAASFPTRPGWSRRLNTYYPTPDMHESIARAVIRHLQGGAGLGNPGKAPVSGPDCAPSPANGNPGGALPLKARKNPVQSVVLRTARMFSRMLRRSPRGLS